MVSAVRLPDVSAGYGGRGDAMTDPRAHRHQPWDEVAKSVAQAVVQHLPDATSTEAEYHLVIQHLAGVLWRLGAAHLALQALGGVYRSAAVGMRRYVATAPVPGARRVDQHWVGAPNPALTRQPERAPDSCSCAQHRYPSSDDVT